MTATLAPAPAAAPAPAERRKANPETLHRIAFLGLLAGAAVLYLWNLTASGYGNEFYAAATQAASQSWKALLFGSLDPGNTITVDKPPAFLWVSGLFAKAFGFSSWTVLAPQALEGVAAVGLLYATVKRTSGPGAALFAGAALALTPVATLMFRFNLPDALLVLLMIAAAYCTVRALEKASPLWLALAGTAVGFAFLTKMMQAFLVLPALALAYLIAAPASIGKRVLHLLGAGVAVVVSAGWFIALVELWPADSRPYIGGSTNNSLWELAIGYNGLGRIFGNSGGGGGGGMGGGMGGNGNIGFGGSTGIGRLFGASMGPEISWLLPAALIGLVAGLWFSRRAPRTDRTRAALVIWGGWTLVSGVVFSFMSGITHPYYTVALAPGIAALVGVSGRELWRGRAHFPARMALTAMVAATGVWGYILLDRTPTWMPWLRWVLLAVTALVVFALVFGVNARRWTAAALVVAALLGTSGYAFATAATTHSGSIPLSGPRSTQQGGGGMREGTSSTEVVQLLKSTDNQWAAATVGAQSAASLQLSSGRPVIAIGGWNGSDPAPTLDEFKALVAAGKVHYFVAGGRGGPGGGSSDIGEWVAANFQAVTAGGETIYDVTAAG